MDDDKGLTDGERMVRRAQKVAMGFAETGLSQAEEMLRRVSPEGRAQARREREARARVRNRLLRQVALVAVAAGLVLAILAIAGLDGPAVEAAVAIVAVAVAGMLVTRRARPVDRETLAIADLTGLPAQTSAWLAGQRRALPAPAVRLTDALGQRLTELEPQLARLPADEPAADAVRKLLAVELPNLVDGYRSIPPSLRRQPRPDGRTADAHLVDGLRLIDEEVARMTEQLARGALDQVATQGRYLELKYRGEV